MLKTLRYYFTNLPSTLRMRFLALAGFIVLAAFVEMLALAALALFITSLTAPETVFSSRHLLTALRLLNPGEPSGPRDIYWLIGLTTLSLIFLKNLLAAAQTYFSARLDGAVNAHYGTRMLRGFLQTPYEKVAQTVSADVVQIVGWRHFIGLFFGAIVSVLCDLTVSTLLVSSLFVLQPVETLAVIVTATATGVGAFVVFRGGINTLSLRSADVHLRMSQVLMRSVQGFRDVILFNRADQMIGAFNTEQEALSRLNAGQRVYERATVWVLETVAIGCVVLGATLLVQAPGTTTVHMMGTLSLVAVSAWRVLPGLYRCTGTLGLMRGYVPVLDRIRDFLDQLSPAEEPVETPRGHALRPFTHAIKLDGVFFRYQGGQYDALQDVTLTIGKGMSIGILGRSGSGKSTLADIMSGLLEPTQGRFLVDGVPMAGRNLVAWRVQIGFVSQNPYLFEGSLAENIAFTLDPDGIDMERVRRACDLAGVSAFLPSLPGGINGKTGERGRQLSGGQAQRVAIARSLYNDPQVLIFDEATSALDTATENTIRETIASLSGQRTIIVIAHRLATVAHCDLLVRMEQGRVVEVGPPEQILPGLAADEQDAPQAEQGPKGTYE